VRDFSDRKLAEKRGTKEKMQESTFTFGRDPTLVIHAARQHLQKKKNWWSGEGKTRSGLRQEGEGPDLFCSCGAYERYDDSRGIRGLEKKRRKGFSPLCMALKDTRGWLSLEGEKKKHASTTHGSVPDITLREWGAKNLRGVLKSKSWHD